MAVPDLAAGLSLGLWAFGAVTYAAKLSRRPAALFDDLRVIPARSGLAAATAGGMAAAGVLATFAPAAASLLLVLSLALHAALAAVVAVLLATAPPDSRQVNPGWHLVFAGFIVGAMSAVLLDLPALAEAIFWPTAAAATAIWALTAAQLARQRTPPPLRPLQAIHLAPASLLTTVAVMTGQIALAMLFAVVAVAIFSLLVVSARRLCESGFSPLWGAFTFPLAAFAGAMIRMEGAWAGFGLGILLLAAVAIPVIGWGVLRMWPDGTLAARTNASKA